MAETQANQDPATPAQSGGSLMGKLIMAGFVGGVVALEVLLAYLFIPSADEVAALAEQKMVQQLPANLSPDNLVGPETDLENTVEIDLGEFSITVPQANTNASLRVDFHLVGIVLDVEANEIKSLFDRNVHRFRDQILFEIRNSEPEDLADPGLGLIKRRILGKSNALFGKPILRSIVFSQFSYVEQ